MQKLEGSAGKNLSKKRCWKICQGTCSFLLAKSWDSQYGKEDLCNFYQ